MKNPFMSTMKTVLFFLFCFIIRVQFLGRSKTRQLTTSPLKRIKKFWTKPLSSGPSIPAAPFILILIQQKHLPTFPPKIIFLGTDRLGRDILARLLYGFRTSLLFALCLTAVMGFLGVLIGGMQGYWGGRVDLFTQRLIEIWSSLPFLYVVILMGSLYGRGFGL